MPAGHSAGPICRSLGELCRGNARLLPPPAAARLERVATRLDAPLELAIAGRVNTGKSTLVNALVGRKVAATDVRDCTRFVTRFRYGAVDRIEVVTVGGARRAVAVDGDGSIPAELGVPVAAVDHIDVYCTSASLRAVTIVDTPGLAAAAGGDDELDSRTGAALRQADALLYVLTRAPLAADLAALAAFRDRTVPALDAPITAIGLLGKADQFDGEDPLAAAEAAAAHHATALRQHLAALVPVAGLLAETTATGTLTEDDTDRLREVAAADPASRELMLASVDLFAELAPIPPPARHRLLAILDLFGVRHATALLAARPGLRAGQLRRALAGVSGSRRLGQLLEASFFAPADAVKAQVGLAAIREIAMACAVAERQRILHAVEEFHRGALGHRLRIAVAVLRVASGAVTVPPPLRAELQRLARGGSAAEQLGAGAVDHAPGESDGTDPAGGTAVRGAAAGQLAEEALRRARYWRAFAGGGVPAPQSRLAYLVHRGYHLLWQELVAAAGQDGVDRG